MPRQSDLLSIYRVARYYYKYNQTQQHIAQIESISRSQVSRMLEKAVQAGIVRVELKFPELTDLSELSVSLSKELGLKRVIIARVKQEPTNDKKDIMDAIARIAAENIPQLLKDSTNIGIGWGKTIYETSLQLEHLNGAKNYCFYPMIGTAGFDTPELHINTITDRFCEKLGARGIYTNIATIRDSGTSLSLTEQERLESLKRSWEHIDTAIVGIGGPPGESSFIGEFSKDFSVKLEQSGTCGDILAQFFYSDLRVYNYEEQYILTAFDITELKKLDNVICLAGGEEKVDAIIVAARQGLIKTLITDSHTAGLIFERI